MSDNYSRNAVIAILLSGLFLGLGLGGQYYLTSLSKQDKIIPLQVAADCQLSVRACTASLNHQTVRVSVTGQASYLKPFELNVALKGFPQTAETRVEARFQMQDMEMGLNRYLLNQTSTNLWHSRVILPVCTRGRKDWTIILIIDTGTGRYQADLPLLVN